MYENKFCFITISSNRWTSFGRQTCENEALPSRGRRCDDDNNDVYQRNACFTAFACINKYNNRYVQIFNEKMGKFCICLTDFLVYISLFLFSLTVRIFVHFVNRHSLSLLTESSTMLMMFWLADTKEINIIFKIRNSLIVL